MPEPTDPRDDADDYRWYGRRARASDLLDQHGRRVGATPVKDAAAQFQLALLRDFLATLEAALADEHVDPEVARRVIRAVIYGGCPSPAEVDMRVRMGADMTERLANAQTPLVIVRDRKPTDPKDHV